MAATFSRAEVLRTVHLFHEPSDVIELRIPKAGRYKTISGYFNEPAVFVDAVVALADEFVGYYFTINPVKPDLLARSANQYKKYAEITTADTDILRRRWLPIDLDPVRPAGISSSEEEHGAALQMAREIRGWLISRGWPAEAFVLANSGNGGHLAAKIDLPNDEAAKNLVKSCLEALDFIFSDAKIKVDTSTFNAARIWKIYGTMARKGSDTPDRPHRLSKIIEPPEELAIVSREQLRELAAILPKSEPIKGSGQGNTFDPVKYAEEHGANVLRTKTWQGGILVTLETCPFNREHDRGEAFLGVQASGAIYFGCKHNSCQGNDWQALKKLWGSLNGHKSHIDKNVARLGEIKKERIRQKFKPEEQEPGADATGPDQNEAIKVKALEILQHGDPIQYIADILLRLVLGAEKAFKKLCCCVAVQGIKQSSGLHPRLSGESGSGKSWVVLTFAHHLPPEAVVKGSSSNLAAFYHQDGDQVFRILDDYQAGNETLDTIIKQTLSVFHQKYDHRTVKKQEPLTLHIGSEQTWAVTSVDGSQDIQVLNRQIPINVDDSEELTRKVNTRTIARYGKGEEQFPEDEAVLVCREIWRILRADGLINVRIPYFERIDWLDTSNRRNPSIFMDLLIAHTSMNRHQREKDSEGYYLATEEDFQAAKALFTDKDAEELVKRLTARERDVIELLITHSGGLTRDEIASKLKPPVATDRVSQIIRGRNGNGGLMQKVQISENRISDMIRLSDDERRTVHKTVYSIKEYDRFAGFDAVVRLKPAPEEPPKQAKHKLCNELCNQTAKHEDHLSKISIEEEERGDAKDAKGDGQENSFSLKNEKNAYLAKAKALDSESTCIGDGKAGLGAKHDKGRAEA